MDDPFGDVFGDAPAPAAKKPAAAAAAKKPAAPAPAPAKPVAAAAAASSPVAAAKPAAPTAAPPKPVVVAAPVAAVESPPSPVAAKPQAPAPPPPMPKPAALVVAPEPAADASPASSPNGGRGVPTSSAESTPAVGRQESPAFLEDDGDPFAIPSSNVPSAEVPAPSKKPLTPVAAVERSILDEEEQPEPPSSNAPFNASKAASSSFVDDDFVVTAPADAVETDAAAAPTVAAAATSVDSDNDEPATESSTSALSASLAASTLEQYVPDEDDAEDELTLVDQNLTALPAEEVRVRGMKLRRIDLSMNKLSSVASLSWPYSAPAWPALTELILDKNQLSSLTGLSNAIPSLTTLWLNNNAVSDLETLLDQLEKLTPNLRYLSMMRNPAVPESYFSDLASPTAAGGANGANGAASPSSMQGGDGGMESYQRFRLYVIYRLKSLQFLDSTPVTAEERKEATVRGAYCRVAKPAEPKKVKSPTSADGSAASPTSQGSDAAGPRQSTVGLSKNAAPPKVATFLAKGKPRYDGTNSEGNRFIMNDDL